MSFDDINKFLHKYGTLSEFREHIDSLKEAINDGNEISKGKNPLDKSKESKKPAGGSDSSAKEVEVDVDGGAQQEQEGMGAPPAEPGQQVGTEQPPTTPGQEPGSQITIGNKVIKKEDDPKAIPIKISNQTEKVDLKPKLIINKNEVTP